VQIIRFGGFVCAEERKEALNRLCGALSGLSIDNLYDLRAERLLKQ